MPAQQLLLIESVEPLPYESELLLYESEPLPYENEVHPGQLVLFTIDPVRTFTESVRTFAGAVGDEGESRFRGICIARGLSVFQAPAGHKGCDFLVNGHRVQVKATAHIAKDRRIHFAAGGRRRFTDYGSETDFFAFVYVGPDTTFNGRLLIMSTGKVLSRWRGPKVSFKIDDLPRNYNLCMLESGGGALGR